MNQTTCIVLLLASLSLSSPGVSQPITPADSSTLAHLKKFRAEYIEGLLDARPEMIADYYTDSVRLMPEFQKTVMGKSSAALYQQAFLARFSVQEYHREAVELIDLGEQVVEIGKFDLKMTLKSRDQPYELAGKYLNIWGRSDGGELLLLAEAWNYDHPFGAEEQLKFDEVPSVDVARQAHLPISIPIRFELAALNCLMETAVTQHDAHLWSAFYADDGAFLYSRHPMYRGRAALNAFFAEHVQELPIFEKLDLRNDRIDELEDYVVVYSSHIAIVRDGDFSGVFTGKDLAIWRRVPNGSLKIYRHIAMYD